MVGEPPKDAPPPEWHAPIQAVAMAESVTCTFRVVVLKPYIWTA